jgi:hypothetical protein
MFSSPVINVMTEIQYIQMVGLMKLIRKPWKKMEFKDVDVKELQVPVFRNGTWA